MEFIEIEAGANVPPVIDDRYPYLSGTFLITANGQASLINHERGFDKVWIDSWKNYAAIKPKMSFTIGMFHFLVANPASVSIAVPFFEKHLIASLKPIYSESTFEGKRNELGLLTSLGILSQEEYQIKKYELEQSWKTQSNS